MGLELIRSLFIKDNTFSGAREEITISATAATGTVNFDYYSQPILYYTTNASANWTLNIRGDANNTFNSITRINEAMTLVFMVTNGATPYYQTGFTIDGTSQTIKWVNQSAPSSGNASSIDIYTFTIIKTADSTYTILGSRDKF